MILRKAGILLAFCFFIGKIHSQVQSPWETVAPPGSFVFSDLRSAAKSASECYRLEISGIEFLRDKKMMARPVLLNELIAFRLLNNNLTAIPSSFNDLPSLKYFESSGNSLTTLSDSMGRWSELRYLVLSGTNFDTLPKGIYSCGHLTSVSIAYNKDTLKLTKDIAGMSRSVSELKIYFTPLDTLPKEMSSTQLNKVVFYKCGLKEFPEPFCQMIRLNELWLDSNSISVLPSSISQMKNLTRLSLRGNRIAHIPGSICFLQNLTMLDLRGNPLDPYEVKTLQALLPSCTILF